MGLDILPSSSPNPWLLRSSLVRSSHIPDYRHLPTFSFALQVFAVHLCITLHHIQIVETNTASTPSYTFRAIVGSIPPQGRFSFADNVP